LYDMCLRYLFPSLSICTAFGHFTSFVQDIVMDIK
jgi:hypothetical protein